MSDASDGGAQAPEAPRAERGVLANLPRTRPQRASPRRAAARAAPTARPEPKTRRGISPAKRAGAPREQAKASSRSAGPKARSGGASAKPRAASARKPSAPIREAAPRQGFESEGDNGRGTLQPPGGAELLSSAVEIVGELAKSGLSRGESVVKGLYSKLSGS